MNPTIDVRIDSMIRAMTEVVLPDLSPGGASAEQAALVLGHLHVLRAQADLAGPFEEFEPVTPSRRPARCLPSLRAAERREGAPAYARRSRRSPIETRPRSVPAPSGYVPPSRDSCTWSRVTVTRRSSRRCRARCCASRACSPRHIAHSSRATAGRARTPCCLTCPAWSAESDRGALHNTTSDGLRHPTRFLGDTPGVTGGLHGVAPCHVVGLFC